MALYADSVARLIEQFEKLPGIGHKSAQRVAFHLLNQNPAVVEQFAATLVEARKSLKFCSVCQNMSDKDVCDICDNVGRDQSVICVVAEPKDIFTFEKTREFLGLYHVLHGLISPLDGVTPDQLKIKELMTRLSDGTVKEIIMATNPDTEGEATAMYISRLLRPMEVKVTRLAYGVPVGSQLEYADEVTLSRALEGRQEM